MVLDERRQKCQMTMGIKKYLREILRGWARIRSDGLNSVLKKICHAFESVHRWCIFTHLFIFSLHMIICIHLSAH